MKNLIKIKMSLFIFPIFILLIINFGAQNILSQATTLGDVNSDTNIDIVDALLTAQYYVGLNPDNFNTGAADVDGSGSIDIVDALLIAQYYVGLINEFPGQGDTPAPTQTPVPTQTPGSGGYSFTGVLNNGYIDGSQVSYTTTATFDGSVVTVTFDGGPGFEWVWLYTPDHHEMTNTGGNVWTATLSGYSTGSTLEYYFTVRKNSQEANNNDARHVWVVGTGSPDDTPTPTQTPTSTPPGTTPDPTSVPGGYTLVWSDEFENSIGSDWVFETGNGSGGWGNNELEYYKRENAYIQNGQLVIEAKKENYGGFEYTSARMKTQGRQSWCYGRIEARIKLPMGQGIWPAFWMLGDNITSVDWPFCGEIDIMEHINNESQIHGTIHWDDNGYVNYGNSTSVNVTDYHVYSIEWDSSAIKWYVDGNQFNEANIENNINSTHEFHNNFFILLNCAVGGNWPGSPDSGTNFPAYMYVDYVRVYQKSTGDPTATPPPNQTPDPTSTPGSTPVPGGNWVVVWEDTFNGSGQPDSSNWNYNVGNGYNTGSDAFDGWGNGEWEWYRPENAYQEGGNLVIKAEYNSNPTSIQGRDWYQFSARLTTQGKHSWQYGRLEARIALPNAPGTWPAFWMMGSSCDSSYTSNYNPSMSHYDTMAGNWASCGELDIMEHRNNESVIVQNLFWDTRTGVYAWEDGSNASNPSENIQVGDVTQFHLYTLEWDSNEFRWYVDRESNPNPTKRVSITASNQEEFHKPFFLMLNLAIQGQFTGPTDPDINDFPLYMYVDYVRVWQQQ